MLVLDGAAGEGGGQILRSALSLSMISGKAFRIEAIRAGRKKPGLLRQHLTAVQACARICNAQIEGAELGSLALTFKPNAIQAGTFEFTIGSAGSACLVAQSVLPALLMADAPSQVSISGGTHNPLAPSATFLQRAFLPLLKTMGWQAELDILRYGFFPAGGGQIRLRTNAYNEGSLQALQLPATGAPAVIGAEVIVSDIPLHVAQRELYVIGKRLGLFDKKIPSESQCETDDDRQAYYKAIAHPALKISTQNCVCPGNALSLFLQWETHAETITGLGEQNIAAEKVANRVVDEARQLLESRAQVGTHLADQLLLPMAIVAWKRGLTSSFDTVQLSTHTTTNMETIAQFLPIAFKVDAREPGLVRISCAR